MLVYILALVLGLTAPVAGTPHDGDSFRIAQADGSSAPVRILGIDTPEIGGRAGVQCYGPEAAARTQEVLRGQEVLLLPDPLQGDKDRYNRLLRYVSAPGVPDLGADLIREGYARVYEEFPVSKTPEYRVLQQQAQAQRKGLWAACS